MKNLSTNKNNLLKLIKKGTSILLLTTLVGSYTGCSANHEEQIDNNQGIETSYDFDFANEYKQEKSNEQYDWSNVLKILKSKNNEVWNLLDTSIDKTMYSSNKFEIAVCEKEDEFGAFYYRIVDNNGLFVNETQYTEAFNINSEYILLWEETYSKETDYQYNYYILNKKTGDCQQVEADFVTTLSGYLIKKTENEKNYYYELLNADGTIASENKYDNYVCDYEKDVLYLYKDFQTEVFDTNTKKARKIDGQVRAASNGYIVIEKNIDNQIKQGAFYLKSLDEELEQIIAYDLQELYFALRSYDKPIFSCSKYDEEQKDFRYTLISTTGEQLINKEYDRIATSYMAGDYILAYNEINGEQNEFDLINQYGVIEMEGCAASYIRVIPLTNKVIYTPGGETGNKDGIMDFDKNIIENPIYDTIIVHKIYNEDQTEIVDCFLIAVNSETNTTTALTKDLEVIASGNYGYGEIEDITINEMNKSNKETKVLTK